MLIKAFQSLTNTCRYVVELAKLLQDRRITPLTFWQNLTVQHNWVEAADRSGLILVMERYAICEEMEWRRQRYDEARSAKFE